MADNVVTAANFLTSPYARNVPQTAGVAVTRGQSLYYDPSTGTVKLFKANGSAPVCNFYGLACDDAAAGQAVLVCVYDPQLTPGFPINAGDVVIGSGTNAGGTCPDADAATGWFKTFLMIGIGNSKANFSPVASGVPK